MSENIMKKGGKVKGFAKSTGKWVLLVFIFIIISTTFMNMMAKSGMTPESVGKVTEKYWGLSNIIGYSIYAIISFLIVPKYMKLRIAKKDETAQKWLTKRKLWQFSLGVFAIFVAIDLLTIQLPYYMMMR